MVDNSGEKSSHKCPVCQKSADKTCSACQNVSYCCVEHQKKHWKIHKNECRAFMVKRNEEVGRYLVATRDIPQGTTLFTEEPITYGPKRCTFPVCLGCYNKVDGSYRCSKCTYPMCSEECEQKPMHAENECVVFQRGSPIGSKISNFDSVCPAYECITPLRCLLLKGRDAQKWGKLCTMEHHNELRKTVPGLWNRNSVNVIKLILDWCKMKDEFAEDDIHSVMGYIDVNCFEIRYQDVQICGVYREAALMAHDCVPNTHNAITATDDHKMIVRSSVPIKKGEMITTSYTNQFSGTRERQWCLKETKYFDCHCARCNDPTEFATYLSAIKCSDCSNGYLLPKDPLCDTCTEWVCTTNTSSASGSDNNGLSNSSKRQQQATSPQCSKAIKEDQVQTIIRKAGKDIDDVSRSTAGSPVSRLERLLKKYSGKILHPNHYLLFNVIKSLNYSYAKLHDQSSSEAESGAKDEIIMDLDHLHRSKSLCLQLLHILDMVDPGLTRLRGVTLFQLSLPDFQIAHTKFESKEISQEEYVESVNKILAYLQTAKDILELDTVVSPNAILYEVIIKRMDSFQNILTGLLSSSST